MRHKHKSNVEPPSKDMQTSKHKNQIGFWKKTKRGDESSSKVQENKQYILLVHPPNKILIKKRI